MDDGRWSIPEPLQRTKRLLLSMLFYFAAKGVVYNFVLFSSFSGDPTSAAVPGRISICKSGGCSGIHSIHFQFLSLFNCAKIPEAFQSLPSFPFHLSLSHIYTIHHTLFALPPSLIVATHDRHRSVPASTLDRTFPVRLSAGGSPLTFLDRLLSIFLIESLANLPYRKKDYSNPPIRTSV